ncbi:MAG TPA: hypothetical protein VNS63_19185 [Blastocatellia bacterium]|nr:hypothetical protein [Blastocatellia bacterium]
MRTRQIRRFISRFSILLLVSGLILVAYSCKSQRSSAEKALEQHLKSPGIRDVKVDLFHVDPKFPDKAYISATVTHNFAGSDGTFKKEYLGYILNRDGEGWQVEKSTGYTKEADDASILLSGEKIRKHG